MPSATSSLGVAEAVDDSSRSANGFVGGTDAACHKKYIASVQADQHLRGPRVAQQLLLSIDMCREARARPQQQTRRPPPMLSIDGTHRRRTDGRMDTGPFYDAYRIGYYVNRVIITTVTMLGAPSGKCKGLFTAHELKTELLNTSELI